MSKIFITGDTHGDVDFEKIINFASLHNELTKQDYVIILGDFGVPWKTPWDGHFKKQDKRLLEQYKEFPFTTLFVDGNHENFNALKQFPCDEWKGGKVQFLNDSVIHLCRSQIFYINGYKFFTLGGAESIDKEFRIPGKSWWREESITYADLDMAADKLALNDFKVDFILTHEMPASIYEKYFLFMHDRWSVSGTSRALDNIYNSTEYKYWFFGHHHVDITDNKHIGLYNKFIDLDNFIVNADESKFFCRLT